MQARFVPPDELTRTDLARWAETAEQSVEPNPFFEPDWLVPALRYMDRAAVVAMVEEKGMLQACVPVVARNDKARLTLETRVAGRGVALGTPLVTEDGGADALACLVDGVVLEAQRRAATLVVMGWVSHDGPVARLLEDTGSKSASNVLVFDRWERAFLRRQDDEAPYWLRSIGKNRRRTIAQHRRQLCRQADGDIDIRIRTDGSAVGSFLLLEASGWKGYKPEGLAFSRDPDSTKFFETVCHHYLDEGRMCFVSLETDRFPVAMVCCLRAGEGMFAYATAYDEALAKYGPGIDVFLATMEYFALSTDAAWLDTCSDRDNDHLLGLFPDRRLLTTLISRPRSRP